MKNFTTVEFADAVAKAYVNFSKDKRDYTVAYKVAKEYMDTGLFQPSDIEKYIASEYITLSHKINVHKLSNILFDVDFEGSSILDVVKKARKIKEEKEKKEKKNDVKNAAFEYCSREGYEAVSKAVDQMSDDELKVVSKFVMIAVHEYRKNK